jgi:hypothetical protein
MRAAEIWPGLSATRTVLVCRAVGAEDGAAERFRVPVEHRPLREHFPMDAAALAAIPDGPSLDDLKSILGETGGLGLFAPKALPLGAAPAGGSWEPASTSEQAAVGSIIVWPPREWARLRSEFADWQYDGGVDQVFAGLPYGFADVVPFASINFSPDCWLLVTRGPMAGKVFWWTHDGDPQLDEPWAESIAAWGARIWREAPGVFGGVIRFDASASEDEVEEGREGVELYPERAEIG